MKKTLLLLASVALLLVSCQKEKFAEEQVGGLTEVTFTASLDNSVATKAAVDGDGAAASVNRCIMEIYYGGERFARQIKKVTNKQATFTAQVVSNRTYTVAFWADKVDATTEAGLQVDKYYTTNATGGLQAIAIKGDYLGNDDARDAFFHTGTYPVAQAGSSFGTTEQPILLKRPFAQMNVITTDWDKAASVTGLAPEKVEVTLKNALNSFNAVTREASGSQNLNYEADVYAPAASGTNSEIKTLSMDYLFASDTKALIDIDWKAKKTGDADVEHAFAAVPYQRNYRTNIKGALLTTQGQWTVEVDPIWETDTNGDFDYAYTSVYDIQGANDFVAQNQDKKEISVTFSTQPNDAGNPSESTEEHPINAIVTSLLKQGATYNIDVASTTDVLYVGDYDYTTTATGTTYDYTVVLEETSEKTKAAAVNLVVTDNLYIGTLVVNSPSKSVSINGQTLESGHSYHIENLQVQEVSMNTVIIESGMVVDNLEMKKGGLEIHGTVHKATVPEGTPIADIKVRDCENLDETLVYNKLKDYIADGYVGVKDRTTVGKWDIIPWVCKIGNIGYGSLADAVAAVQEGETITLVKNVENASGIAINTHKNFTIDFGGHIYTVNKPGAGSTGTQTAAFQLIKGQTITFKNGTIKAAEDNLTEAVAPAKNIKRMFQSYANVTFEDMTIDGTNIYGNNSVCEFACGAVDIKGTTSITTGKQGVAVINVDTWKGAYPEGAQVTISSTGEFGDIYLYAEEAGEYTKSSLTIKDGKFGKVYGDDSGDWTASIIGGVFSEKPDSQYLPNAYYAQQEGNKWRVVYDDSYVVRVNETYYKTWKEAAQVATNAYGSPVENSEIEVIKNCTASDYILKSSGHIKLIVNPDVTLTSTIGNALISTNPGNTGVEIVGGGNIDCSNGTLVDAGHGGVILDNVYVKAENLVRNDVPVLTVKSGKYEKIGNYAFINSGCDVTIMDAAIFNCDISSYAKAGKTCEEISGMPGWYHMADLTEANAAFKVTNNSIVTYFGATADYCKFDNTAEGWIRSSQKDGDEITLLKDIQGYFILSKNDVTLDLNGKTLNGSLSYNTYLDGSVCCIFGENQIVKNGKIDLSGCSNAANAIDVGLNCRIGSSFESMNPAKSVSVIDVETDVAHNSNNYWSVQYARREASYVSTINLSGVQFSSYNGRNILPITKNDSQFIINIDNGCKFYTTWKQKSLMDKTKVYNTSNITQYLLTSQKLNGTESESWREVVAK